jgi:hypothetical protein
MMAPSCHGKQHPNVDNTAYILWKGSAMGLECIDQDVFIEW